MMDTYDTTSLEDITAFSQVSLSESDEDRLHKIRWI